MTKKTNEQILDEARKHIGEAIRKKSNGYSNNVVGASLRVVATEINYEAADALIDEFKIERIFGIPKSGKTGKMTGF